MLKMSNIRTYNKFVYLISFTKNPEGKNFLSSVSERPYKCLILVTSTPTPNFLNPLTLPTILQE